jgi:hypothetical protein
VNGLISQQAIHAFDPMPQGGFSGNLLRQTAQAQRPPFYHSAHLGMECFRLFLMQRTQTIPQHSLYNRFRMHGSTPSTFAHREGAFYRRHAFLCYSKSSTYHYYQESSFWMREKEWVERKFVVA